MNKRFKKVPTVGITAEELMVLWREGRLYVDESKRTVSREQVKNNVRAYVARVKPFVTHGYESSVDELWEKILDVDELVDFLMPTAKAKLFRDFNKYSVVRIIGVLREFSVYEQRSDRKYDALLESEEKESPYRRFLGMGIEPYSLLVKIRQIVEQYEL